MAVLLEQPTNEERKAYYKVRVCSNQENIAYMLEEMGFDLDEIDQRDFDYIVEAYDEAIDYDWSQIARDCIYDRLDRKE